MINIYIHITHIFERKQVLHDIYSNLIPDYDDLDISWEMDVVAVYLSDLPFAFHYPQLVQHVTNVMIVP